MKEFLKLHDQGQIVFEYKNYQLIYIGFMNGKSSAGHEFFIVNYPINKSFGKNLGQITLEQAKKEMIYFVDSR